MIAVRQNKKNNLCHVQTQNRLLASTTLKTGIHRYSPVFEWSVGDNTVIRMPIDLYVWRILHSCYSVGKIGLSCMTVFGNCCCIGESRENTGPSLGFGKIKAFEKKIRQRCQMLHFIMKV